MKQIAEPPHVQMPQPRLEIKDAEVVFLKKLWRNILTHIPSTVCSRQDILNTWGYAKLFDVSQSVLMVDMSHLMFNGKPVGTITDADMLDKIRIMTWRQHHMVKYNILGDFEFSVDGNKFTNSIVCFEPNR